MLKKNFYNHLVNAYNLIKRDVPLNIKAGGIKYSDLNDEDKMLLNI